MISSFFNIISYGILVEKKTVREKYTSNYLWWKKKRRQVILWARYHGILGRQPSEFKGKKLGKLFPSILLGHEFRFCRTYHLHSVSYVTHTHTPNILCPIKVWKTIYNTGTRSFHILLQNKLLHILLCYT